MAITYPLTFPTSFGLSSFSIELKRAVAVTTSQFSFKQQVQEHPGEAWQISGSLDLLNREQSEEYEAFMLMLAGRVGTFLFSPPGSETPRGAATGTPLVNGAGQTGREINTDGWTPDVTGILKAGDFVQFGSGSTATLHKQLIDADSDSGGLVALMLAPKVVSAPDDGSTLVVTNAAGVFRLSANAVPISTTPPNQRSMSFRAMEVR